MNFDFNEAARDARRDYPEETRDITFVSNDGSFSSRKQMQTWLELTSAEYKTWIASVLGIDQESVVEVFSERMHEISRRGKGASFKDPVSGKGIMIAVSLDGEAGTINDPRLRFDHELGHLLLDNGFSDYERNLQTPPANGLQVVMKKHESEIAADVFSVLRGLQQGTIDEEFVRLYSKERLRMVLDHRDYPHFTSQAVDALLADKDRAGILSLSKRQIKDIAEDYAGRFKAGEADFVQIAKFRFLEEGDRTQYLEQVRREAPAGTLSFYFATQLIREVDEKKSQKPAIKPPTH